MSGGLDTPVYHLDGVVHTKSERENFDGPLDLILSLLSKNKMEIEEIQLSLILEQYLAWMNQRQELNLEVASEFVTMAAHLAYIKTRMLLSLQDEEAVSEMEELIASLEERKRSESYEKIRQATPLLRERYAVGKDYLSKPAEPIQRERAYRYQHQPDDLPKALQRILRRRQEQSPPAAAAFEGIVRREPYPVAEKVHEILTGLGRRCDTVPGAVPPQQEPVRGRRDLSGGAGAVPAEADLSGRRGSGLHGGPNWGANAKESGREVPRAGRTGQKEW